MKLQEIHNRTRWLREQGLLNVLTSEADGTNLGRLLCDLSEEGAEYMTEFLSIGTEIEAKNWNPKITKGVPAARSIMLDQGTINRFALFCMLMRSRDGRVVEYQGWEDGPVAWFYATEDTSQEEIDALEKMMSDAHSWRTWYSAGTAGTRNTHEFTGRTT